MVEDVRRDEGGNGLPCEELETVMGLDEDLEDTVEDEVLRIDFELVALILATLLDVNFVVRVELDSAEMMVLTDEPVVDRGCRELVRGVVNVELQCLRKWAFWAM